MRKQEKTRLAELTAETSHYEAIQAHNDIVSKLEFSIFSAIFFYLILDMIAK